MFQTFRNAWKIPELKNRLLFTLAILVVYRLGCAIPVPFVSGSALTQMFANGDMLSYLNMMSGGALARCTLFALGATPYINASIIVQLLRRELFSVLKSLTPREERVIALRFGLEDGRAHTLEELGKEFNVTRERVRQIEAKALRKLRHPSRAKRLRDYLDE